MHRAKTYPKCGAPGCNDRGNVARGLCQFHYGQYRLARQKNGSWDAEQGQALNRPPIPPFEYEGDEAALIALTEQREREQQAKDSKAEETYHDRYRTFHSR